MYAATLHTVQQGSGAGQYYERSPPSPTQGYDQQRRPALPKHRSSTSRRLPSPHRLASASKADEALANAKHNAATVLGINPSSSRTSGRPKRHAAASSKEDDQPKLVTKKREQHAVNSKKTRSTIEVKKVVASKKTPSRSSLSRASPSPAQGVESFPTRPPMGPEQRDQCPSGGRATTAERQ